MLPVLHELPSSRQTISVFGGLDRRPTVPEGFFAAMENMTSDAYPVAASRAPRTVLAASSHLRALTTAGALCWVDGRDLVLGGCRIQPGLGDDLPKQLVSMGAYLLIFPDGIWVNTANWEPETGVFHPENGWGYLDNVRDSSAAGYVTLSLCHADGTPWVVEHLQEPEQPAAGAVWLDQSVTPHVLRTYAADSGMWVIVESTYVRLEAPGIGRGFAPEDGVTVSGLEGELHEYAGGTQLLGSAAEQLHNLCGSAQLTACGEDFVVVPGLLDGTVTVSATVTVARQAPRMDFVVESGNRLWGCRYGLSRAGTFVNEIYACRLGDFRNWHCFAGISTDSYAASLGSEGPFTGAVTHLGTPLFFRETCMHRIYGTVPANFQIQTTACRGVQQGCSGSLAIVDEILYYKSRHGVCAFDGSLPVEISAPLGSGVWEDAAGGGFRSKYYISMAQAGRHSLFVYDVGRRLWHREDGLRASHFAAFGGGLWCIDRDGGRILSVAGEGGGTAAETAVPWLLETGDIGLTLPDARYVTALTLRLAAEPGTEVRISVMYDGSGRWEPLLTLPGSGLRSRSVPIRPRRCDHLRLRLEGRGAVRLYALTRTVEEGSERP